MSRVLKKQDILEILYGATFLGGGGGGSLSFGINMLEKLEEQGEEIAFEMLEVDELEKDDYAAMVAGLGSPVAMLEGTFGPDAVHAFKAFQRAFAAEGKTVKYLYPGEMGGFNTFVPMMVAILSDKDVSKRIKFVDTDGNGRAVPELNTTLTDLRGYPPSPIGLGNGTGDQIIAYATDDKAAEVIARQLCMAYGMQIGFSTWGLSRDEMKEHSAVGCVTYAQKIGKVLLRLMEDKSLDILEELSKVMQIRQMCRGTIEKVDLKAEGGFDFGTTTVVTPEDRRFYIDFKNENLLVRDDDGKVYITAPEVICLMNMSTYEPLTNADIKEGMDIFVGIAPVNERWWMEDYKAYMCWKPLFEVIGYKGDFVRF